MTAELSLPTWIADIGQKAFHAGTHRTVTPTATLGRAEPLMPVMGITRIADVTGLDVIGIPVVMVCRPNSRSIAVSQGKGQDLMAAKASGLMESIETYHAEHITLPLLLASHEELRYTHNLVDVSALPIVESGIWNPVAPLLWIEGHDLLNDESIWVPYEIVHTNYTLPTHPQSGVFAASSNGLASGNHLLEAISHGITEVVERDATALWHHLGSESKDQTRVNLDTVDHPECRKLLEKYERADIAVAVWETTTDIGLPSYYCMIMNCKDQAHAAVGAGCHPCRSVALSRALTEAAQDRITLISGSRDDLMRTDYQPVPDSEVLIQRRALMSEKPAPRRYADGPNRESSTLEEDVRWELERLNLAGIEQVIVVDLTKRNHFDIPVARVIIPGLEGPEDRQDYIPGKRARAVMELHS